MLIRKIAKICCGADNGVLIRRQTNRALLSLTVAISAGCAAGPTPEQVQARAERVAEQQREEREANQEDSAKWLATREYEAGNRLFQYLYTSRASEATVRELAGAPDKVLADGTWNYDGSLVSRQFNFSEGGQVIQYCLGQYEDKYFLSALCMRR